MVNPCFFHARASRRRRQYIVQALIDNEGNWVIDSYGIEDIFCNYYFDLFTSFCPSLSQETVAL